jgi:hypothetical protein
MTLSVQWKWEIDTITLKCRLPDRTIRCYLAQIIGPDPNYVLKREFVEDYGYYRDRWGYLAEFHLDYDGVYDLWTRSEDPETGELQKEHKWLIRFGETLYIYDYHEMNARYILYTLFNLRLQGAVMPHDFDDERKEV